MFEEIGSAGSLTGSPLVRVLRLRDFRLLWIGQATSLLGDHFHFIAISWLVLQLTNDPLALGMVLALGGVPRAIFTLIGGAITDRFSPRTVMLLSDLGRLALTLVLAVLVLTGAMQVWMFYGFALIFGVVSGFFLPASMAILPTVTRPEELQGGNALVQGSSQLVSFLGPMLAGGVIAWFAHFGAASTASPQLGVGVALLLDAATFAISVVTLWLIQARAARQTGAAAAQQDVWQAIRQGLHYAWEQPMLRSLLILIAALNLLIVGPLAVGVPVLANQRLAEGAAAFGIIMGAYAGGNLLGIVVAGMVRTTRATGLIVILFVTFFGAGMMAMGWITTTWAGAAIMAALGLGNGYLSIRLITYLQRRTPPDLLGRIMSLILFANVGLAPLSQAIAGALSRGSVSWLFFGAGVALVGVAVWLALQPFVRTMDRELDVTSSLGT
ncbi:MAG: MFS transporter [Caldilineaceae bacterium]|jgi:MFS family permease|nr:MFS transporter [Caldilineaceae bacterium]